MGPLAHIERGLPSVGWYDEARDTCERIARDLGYTLPEVADVIAVTSPRVTVRRNVALAVAYLRGAPLPGMLPGVRAALTHWRDTGEIRGPKTRAFSDAIQGDTSAVVVDVWVQRAWGIEGGLRAPQRRRIVHAMRSLSGRLGVTPRDAQEALWVSIRKEHGRTSDARFGEYYA